MSSAPTSADRHVVVGAGPVGRHVAAELATRGSHVTVVTRSGRDTGVAGVTHLALDASDADALTRVADGADVLYNCANPGDYTQWERVWPPLAAALLTAVERTGAVYAITGNLYPYGPVDGPMTEDLPDAATDHKGVLRARLWADALAAHRAGRARVVEVRSSDFVGPGVGGNGHVSRVVPAALRGRAVTMIGRTDQPHTFTDVRDAARTLVAAAADPGAHGRTWHTPSNPPRTQRDALTDVLASVGHPPVRVRSLRGAGLAAAGLFSPLLRELRDLAYQWDRPYVLDDTAARTRFGIEPTPWDEVCRRTARG
ncbi:NAD-dependent epimerase/dehydratase family protein [Cellulosimicrobium protaetiae]|uniref:NAD-dependent epimerase/dehydratase family protein n=1 Tax=Cellulosimicrobium protaetiae TaxID=2587808 RepID=A0A6M5UBJ5_9MICO|nr:NAD-dependent epimerase/dehydratase family protein [Cellulosimicrobium protaetiae]QJW35876.1 NAD-dependent epimerase/dehydratase family protein [Cellulosimicrobium protaetiae]